VSTDLGRAVARHWILAAPVLLGLVLRLRSDAGIGATAAVGLAAMVAAYAVCVHWGVWRWLAAAATVPAAAGNRLLVDQPWLTTCALLVVSLGLVVLAFDGLPRSGAGLVVGALATAAGGVAGFLGDVSTGDPGVGSLHLGWEAAGGLPLLVAGLAAVGVGRSAIGDGRVLTGTCALAGTVNEPVLLVWLSAAGALGLTLLLRGRRGRAAGLPQQDQVDEVAIAEFRERYGRPRLGPVVILIAAYNEAEGIPAVLEALPVDVCGLHTDVVVVDDGSSDGTSAAIAGARAHVVTCATNRGQGAALRLGYRVARDHGAAYVITTDADGQYAVSDMPALLTPILEDRADFVTGSRILGRQETRDRVRRLGVHVFAWWATILTGRRFTDTSFGLRAMRAELTGVVTLNQPQYQSSELLLGAVSHGYRVAEVPGSMHLRSAGGSKKGRNFVYGRRYARAMTGTWWREGLPRPVSETAPALRHTRTHGD
jgi:hypothetical protein